MPVHVPPPPSPTVVPSTQRNHFAYTCFVTYTATAVQQYQFNIVCVHLSGSAVQFPTENYTTVTFIPRTCLQTNTESERHQVQQVQQVQLFNS